MQRDTTKQGAEQMKVAEYRRLIGNLEHVVNCDFHACVGKDEKARWVAIARKVGSELIKAKCPRATQADRDRAERIIDASSDRIISVIGY